MESELSAHRLPDFPIPSQGADPAVSQGGQLVLVPPFWGMHTLQDQVQEEEPASTKSLLFCTNLATQNSCNKEIVSVIKPHC